MKLNGTNYITLKEAAKQTGLGIWRFKAMIKNGTLKGYKLGGIVMLLETDLDNLIKPI